MRPTSSQLSAIPVAASSMSSMSASSDSASLRDRRISSGSPRDDRSDANDGLLPGMLYEPSLPNSESGILNGTPRRTADWYSMSYLLSNSLTEPNIFLSRNALTICWNSVLLDGPPELDRLSQRVARAPKYSSSNCLSDMRSKSA